MRGRGSIRMTALVLAVALLGVLCMGGGLYLDSAIDGESARISGIEKSATSIVGESAQEGEIVIEGDAVPMASASEMDSSTDRLLLGVMSSVAITGTVVAAGVAAMLMSTRRRKRI